MTSISSSSQDWGSKRYYYSIIKSSSSSWSWLFQSALWLLLLKCVFYTSKMHAVYIYLKVLTLPQVMSGKLDMIYEKGFFIAQRSSSWHIGSSKHVNVKFNSKSKRETRAVTFWAMVCINIISFVGRQSMIIEIDRDLIVVYLYLASAHETLDNHLTFNKWWHTW